MANTDIDTKEIDRNYLEYLMYQDFVASIKIF